MDDSGGQFASYVVRVSREGSDRISGVLVRVATGERFAFEALDRLAELLRERVTADLAEPM
jgi:hypothetical protein